MAKSNFFSVLNIAKIVLTFILLYQGHLSASTSVTEYESMPALYKFDNYKECIDHNDSEQSFPAKYCMVLVQIQPNINSSIWQQINKISAKKLNYRHDNIFRGVCMERCKNVLKSKQNNSDNGLLINQQTKELEKFFNSSFDRTMRQQFHRDIHECINQEYLENYNFSTKTFVNYCIDPQQRKPKDIYFNLTIILFIVIILLNIFSSLYDAKLKPVQLKSNDQDNYYEIKHKDKVNRYLTAFSLYRNYKRLVVPNKSDIGSDLGFLDGFRTILCILILLEHIFLIEYIHLENGEFIENAYTQLWARLLMHSLVWLELFFVLSGLLLFVKFEKAKYITPESSFMDCVSVFGRLIVSRYLRYLPSLLFIIIVNANISYYHENGPFTRFIIEPSCLPCRNVWWHNILMTVNYNIKSSCLMHTWYIAADFHLYAFFLLILIIIAKYPKTKTLVLSGVAILAAAINVGVNYILKLDSIFTLAPESYRYFYFQNIDMAKYLYFSSYTNINSFLVGIVCGLIYMKYLRKNDDNKKKLSKILKNAPYIGWTCIVGILYLGTQIMEHTETTIWTASYGLLQRHVGLSIVAIVVILRGFCNGGGIFKSTPFRFMARISYQFYLWQIVVLINLFAYYDKPLYVSFFILPLIALFLFVCTSIISFVVALFVEYPCAEIIATIDIEKNLRRVKTE